MDETGCLGFNPGGTNFFVLAFVTPESVKQLNKCIKNFNAHLIRSGWNQDVEIKGANIWHSPKNAEIPSTYKYKNNPAEPLNYVLNAISGIDGFIEYVVIKLDTIKIKTAPNAILYNYFAFQLLRRPLCYFPAVELFVDRRNREYHNLLKFDGYLEGKVGIKRAEKELPALNLQIHHLHHGSAHECKTEEKPRVEFGIRGIEASDLVCWAIKRKFEDGDEQWYKLIEKRIKNKQQLYF
jgi:hypothetical protein